MGDIPDIKNDLPTSMAMAAFVGISWYIGLEINTSLFMLFKRRRGLYFWSCAFGSWGVILQPLFIILADFDIWTNLKGSVTMIYLTWFIMVVPQSWVLFSRLHLVIHDDKTLKWIKAVLLFDSIAFSVPTIVLGILAQTSNNPRLLRINTAWDRTQLIVFFVQETSLSILYIYQTRKYLRDRSHLIRPTGVTASSPSSPTSPSSFRPSNAGDRQVLHHLIYTNLLVIALDVALLGIQCADLFYLQGAFKPCVYGLKLKVEFAILNRLVRSVRARGSGETYGGGLPAATAAGDAPGRGGGSSRRPKVSFWTSRRARAARSAAGGGDQDQDQDQGIGLGHVEVQKGLSTQSSQTSQTPILMERRRGDV